MNYDNVNQNNKPKHTIQQVINKFLIDWNLKLHGIKIQVYFSWKKKQPKWIFLEDGNAHPEKPYFTVDYNKKKREWDIGYIVSVEDRKFATIDDITGSCTLH